MIEQLVNFTREKLIQKLFYKLMEKRIANSSALRRRTQTLWLGNLIPFAVVNFASACKYFC